MRKMRGIPAPPEDYDLTTIDFHILLVYALLCGFCKRKQMSSKFRYYAKTAKIRRFKA